MSGGGIEKGEGVGRAGRGAASARRRGTRGDDGAAGAGVGAWVEGRCVCGREKGEGRRMQPGAGGREGEGGLSGECFFPWPRSLSNPALSLSTHTPPPTHTMSQLDIDAEMAALADLAPPEPVVQKVSEEEGQGGGGKRAKAARRGRRPPPALPALPRTPPQTNTLIPCRVTRGKAGPRTARRRVSHPPPPQPTLHDLPLQDKRHVC